MDKDPQLVKKPASTILSSTSSEKRKNQRLAELPGEGIPKPAGLNVKAFSLTPTNLFSFKGGPDLIMIGSMQKCISIGGPSAILDQNSALKVRTSTLKLESENN